MKISSEVLRGLAIAGLAITAVATPLRQVVYIDQYHLTTLPGKNITGGITHAIIAFANSSLFTTDPPGEYQPFMNVADVRAMFSNGTKVGIAIGGWGDTAGFSKGAATNESRALYARNVRKMADDHGFDFVDIDWEYPAGNGADYKQIPNANKTTEITTFPLFLHALKAALGDKPLSIAVPGTKPDMVAYESYQAPSIFEAVDMINLMSYDLMMRRSNETKHHTSVLGSLEAVLNYLDIGAPASKINLGFAFYAKYFQTPANATCDGPIGCSIVAAENADGTDAGTSGAMTFEAANVHPPPAPAAGQQLVMTTNGTCGPASGGLTCAGHPEAPCCSPYGYCGSTAEFCNMLTLGDYSDSAYDGPSAAKSFLAALANGRVDDDQGGVWFWDKDAHLFWTWDSVDMMARKFREIVTPLRLGGVMAWSLGEDSADWEHLRAMIALASKGRPTPESQGGVVSRQVGGNMHRVRAPRAHRHHNVH